MNQQLYFVYMIELYIAGFGREAIEVLLAYTVFLVML